MLKTLASVKGWRKHGKPKSNSLRCRLSPHRKIEMIRNISVVLYIVGLIAVVVSVDLLFFKNRFWERLMVNIGIVLVFAAFYLRFLKHP